MRQGKAIRRSLGKGKGKEKGNEKEKGNWGRKEKGKWGRKEKRKGDKVHNNPLSFGLCYLTLEEKKRLPKHPLNEASLE